MVTRLLLLTGRQDKREMQVPYLVPLGLGPNVSVSGATV